MAAEKATAIVLRVVDFSESSCVLTLLTREMGKVRAMAKGGRRPKGPFESALDLLALCRIVFLRKSSDALDLLTEAKLMRRFRPRSGDLAALYAGYYIAEMLDALTDEYDPHPELFDLADDTLRKLATDGSAAALVLRFEMRALSLLGHLPTLEQCAECGVAVQADNRRRIAFGQLSGGVLCGKCRTGKRQVVSVSEQGIKLLRELATPTASDQKIQDPEAGVRNELRAVMNHYFNNLLGRRPRTQKYLGV